MFETIKTSGKWHITDQKEEYQGDLYIDQENNSIVLELFIPANKDEPLPSFKYKGKIKYISGTTNTGVKVLLLNCRTGHEQNKLFHDTQQLIYADYAFDGLNVRNPDELLFSKALFSFGEIVQWSGLCYYDWDLKEESRFTLNWHHEKGVDLAINDNLQISIYPNIGSMRSRIMSTKYEVEQKIEFAFVYKTSVSWETIMKDVLFINQLISLGMHQAISVNEIKYFHPSLFSEHTDKAGKVMKHELPVNVFIGTKEKRRNISDITYDYLFSLTDLLKQPNNCIELWSEKYDKLKPILDLYATAFNNLAGTAEMLFINLTQAIETYHSRFVINSIGKYKKRVRELINNLYKENHTAAQLYTDFLYGSCQKNNSKNVLLESRIADLLFADGEFPFSLVNCSQENFVRKVVDTRNYYTHYNESKKHKVYNLEELKWVNSILLLILEYHILIEIGFDKQYVVKNITQRNTRINQNSNINKKVT